MTGYFVEFQQSLALPRAPARGSESLAQRDEAQRRAVLGLLLESDRPRAVGEDDRVKALPDRYALRHPARLIVARGTHEDMRCFSAGDAHVHAPLAARAR